MTKETDEWWGFYGVQDSTDIDINRLGENRPLPFRQLTYAPPGSDLGNDTVGVKILYDASGQRLEQVKVIYKPYARLKHLRDFYGDKADLYLPDYFPRLTKPIAAPAPVLPKRNVPPRPSPPPHKNEPLPISNPALTPPPHPDSMPRQVVVPVELAPRPEKASPKRAAILSIPRRGREASNVLSIDKDNIVLAVSQGDRSIGAEQTTKLLKSAGQLAGEPYAVVTKVINEFQFRSNRSVIAVVYEADQFNYSHVEPQVLITGSTRIPFREQVVKHPSRNARYLLLLPTECLPALNEPDLFGADPDFSRNFASRTRALHSLNEGIVDQDEAKKLVVQVIEPLTNFLNKKGPKQNEIVELNQKFAVFRAELDRYTSPRYSQELTMALINLNK